jgi:hypothetical protein
VQTPPEEAEETQLFGTETMAELCARQGRLGEAIRIYQRLLAQDPAPDKLARWTDRCRSLERARAHAPDLALPELGAEPPRAERAKRPSKRDSKAEDTGIASVPVASGSPARAAGASSPAAAADSAAPGSAFDDRDITVVEPVPAGEPAADAAAEAKANVNAQPATPAAPVAAVAPQIEVEEPHRLPMVITQPVRSGQVVYARKNDLIVLASVNPGGQVVADGNIHIYGALRGRALAGVQGATDARIFCQRLEAELLAISGIYLIWDDIPKAQLGKPAQISLQGPICVVSPL